MDADQAAGVIDAAIDLGVNLIDTADIYSHGVSEEYIGQAVGYKTGKRDSVLIATKFGMDWEDGAHGQGGSRKHIIRAVEGRIEHHSIAPLLQHSATPSFSPLLLRYLPVF